MSVWVSGPVNWPEMKGEGNGTRWVHSYRDGPHIGTLWPQDPGWFVECSACDWRWDAKLMRSAADAVARHHYDAHRAAESLS
jgi:hypothetical protein